MWYQSRRSSDCRGTVDDSGWERSRQECLQSMQASVQDLRAAIKDWRLENEAMYKEFKSYLLVMKEEAKLVNVRSDLVPSHVLEKADLVPSYVEEKEVDEKADCVSFYVDANVDFESFHVEEKTDLVCSSVSGLERQRQRRRHNRQGSSKHLLNNSSVMTAVKAHFICGRKCSVSCINRCSYGKIRSTIFICPSHHSGNFLFHPSTIAGRYYGGHTSYDWSSSLMISCGFLIVNDLLDNGLLAYFSWDPGGEIFLQFTAILTVYAKCDNVDTVWCIFDAIEFKKVVCCIFGAMIGGYKFNFIFREAIRLFRRMIGKDVIMKQNEVAALSCVAACAGLGPIRLGKTVHEYAMLTDMDMYYPVAILLVARYENSEDVSACKVFEEMCVGSFVLWNAMIREEGLEGHGKEALCLGTIMVSGGHRPSEITFNSLLSVCSHVCWVKDGLKCFNSMDEQRCIDTHNLILKMEVDPDVAVWGSLLGACQVHKNCKLEELAKTVLMKMDFSSAGYHVLLANMSNDNGTDLFWLATRCLQFELRERPRIKSVLNALASLMYHHMF